MKGSDTINCRVLKKGKCEITQSYNPNHNGIDLVGENFTLDDIVSHSDGEIVDLRDGYDNQRGTNSYGNYIKINHKNGYYTLYAHLEKGLNLKIGDIVKQGQILGTMGESGDTNGKHLHFEVFNEDKKINPTNYLNNNFISNDNNSENELKYSIGQTVKIKEVYISSTSTEKLVPKITEGKITRIVEGTRNPYLLEDGKIGWINDNSIESIIEPSQQIKYLSNTTYKGFSIVDALKQINVDSSYTNRSKLAKINNIDNYKGTAIQNTNMLNLLKQGKLKSN